MQTPLVLLQMSINNLIWKENINTIKTLWCIKLQLPFFKLSSIKMLNYF